jgi:competence protein ComEC
VLLYPPLGEGDLNEQGLTVLCSTGDYDALITGDMAGSTEKKLLERYPLPDIELLVVGHHGSKYSSTKEFLDAVRPETAVISVGDNSYGHPTDQALLRLVAAGCEIYRTDLQGNVLVTVEGEE